MGTFYVSGVVGNHVKRTKTARVARLLVDTGSDYTWIPERVLRAVAVAEEKRDLVFTMANGQTITRNVGFAIIRVNGHFTIDEVVFARPGDLAILGARTLEGLNLRVDARAKKLVAGGPLLAG
jgi:predicted aspartyl protease